MTIYRPWKRLSAALPVIALATSSPMARAAEPVETPQMNPAVYRVEADVAPALPHVLRVDSTQAYPRDGFGRSPESFVFHDDPPQAPAIQTILSLPRHQAQTRHECELEVRPNTKMAVDAGVGGVTGGVTGAIVGAAACTGFLGLVFLDFGLVYSVCLAIVTAAGTTAGGAIGTAIAEDTAVQQMKSCASLGND